MKRFNANRHAIAFGAMPAITAALILAQSSASAAIAVVTQQSQANQSSFDVQDFHDSIDHLNDMRTLVGQTKANIDREDTKVVEAKDIDHVISALIGTGLIANTSPVIDLLKTQDLGQVLDSFAAMAEDVTGTIMWARDSMPADGTDSYLVQAKTVQQKMVDLVKFGQDLQMIIAATWRDHNNQQPFIVPDTTSSAETKQTVAA